MSTNQQILQTLNSLPPQQLSELDLENMFDPDEIKDVPVCQNLMPAPQPVNVAPATTEDQPAQENFDFGQNAWNDGRVVADAAAFAGVSAETDV